MYNYSIGKTTILMATITFTNILY